jgi:hypothetical protein
MLRKNRITDQKRTDETDEEFLDRILDDIEKKRTLRGCKNLEQSHSSRFFPKERNSDDDPLYNSNPEIRITRHLPKKKL